MRITRRQMLWTGAALGVLPGTARPLAAAQEGTAAQAVDNVFARRGTGGSATGRMRSGRDRTPATGRLPGT
jgi:hypothetical protein